MVADADAVLDAMDGDDGALSAARAGDAIWLQMSTIGVDGTERCVELAASTGSRSSTRRCSGPRRPPSRASSSSWPPGPSGCATALQPIFDVRRRAHDVGRRGRRRDAAQARHQRWILTVVEGAAETLALAEGLGLDPQLRARRRQGRAARPRPICR